MVEEGIVTRNNDRKDWGTSLNRHVEGAFLERQQRSGVISGAFWEQEHVDLKSPKGKKLFIVLYLDVPSVAYSFQLRG